MSDREYKCVVCEEKHVYFPYKPMIQSKIMRVCSQHCYLEFCREYALCKYEVKIDEMKKRLEAYRTRREERIEK